MTKTIELDCWPGSPRPGDLIGSVVHGTSLQSHLNETVSRIFGCWTWAFPDIPDEEWRNIQKITKPRVEELYNEGFIRYGSW